VKKTIFEGKTDQLAAHSNRVEDFQYDHEVVYMQNSIVNVDAVENIYIKAAQGDSKLNAKLINVSANYAGSCHGWSPLRKTNTVSLPEYLASDQSKYNRVVGLTSVTPVMRTN
jgi:hypothetical protein